MLCLVAQLCPDSLRPMRIDRSSVHGDSPGRILECVAMPSSRGSSQPRNWTGVFCIAGGFFTSWATQEALDTVNQELDRCSKDGLSLLHDIWCIRWKDSEAGDDWMAGVLHRVEAAPPHMCGDWLWFLAGTSAGAPIWLLCLAWGFLIAWWLDSKSRLIVS